MNTADVPGLDELLGWARDLAPVEITGDAPDGTVDLDEIGVDPAAPPDPAALTDDLRGASAARGAVLATPAGARAVLAAGVPAIVPVPGQPAAALLLRLVNEMDHKEEERFR
jgi:hypothetical protein